MKKSNLKVATACKETFIIHGILELLWLPKFFCYWCCCYCGCGCCSGCPTTALTACHPMPPLLLPPSPSSSAFFLAADNQQLPRPFANFHRRPAKHNYKDMDKDKYRYKEKCKIRQSTIQQLLFQKWSWKEKCPPVAKNCQTLSVKVCNSTSAISILLLCQTMRPDDVLQHCRQDKAALIQTHRIMNIHHLA